MDKLTRQRVRAELAKRETCTLTADKDGLMMKDQVGWPKSKKIPLAWISGGKLESFGSNRKFP